MRISAGTAQRGRSAKLTVPTVASSVSMNHSASVAMT